MIQRFPLERRKTKTKVVTTASQKKGLYPEEPMKAQREKTCKLPTARENAGDHVVTDVSFAFDWLRERGTSFLDQSQSEVKQNQCNPVLLN